MEARSLLRSFQHGDERNKRSRYEALGAIAAPRERRMRTISREVSREENSREYESATNYHDDNAEEDNYSSDVDDYQEDEKGLSDIIEQLTQDNYSDAFLSIDDFVKDNIKEVCEADPREVLRRSTTRVFEGKYDAVHSKNTEKVPQLQASQEHNQQAVFKTPAAKRPQLPMNDSDDDESDEENDELCRLALEQYYSSQKQLPNASAQSTNNEEPNQISAPNLEPRPSTPSKAVKNYKQTTLFPSSVPKIAKTSKSTKKTKSSRRGKEIDEGQKTLTQVFREQDEPPSPHPLAVFKDTTDKVFIGRGNSFKMFKHGETYVAQPGKQRLLCTIISFGRVGLQKTALCRCFRELADTFLGPEMAMQLQEDPSYKQYYRENPQDRKLIQDVEERVLLLSQFISQYTGASPQTILAYQVNSPGKTMSKEFSVSFHYIGPSRAFRRTTHGMTRRMPAMLELFAGCGGSSTGYKSAGFHVKYLNEINPAAVGTLRVNHPEATIFDECVKEMLKKMKEGDLCYPKPGELDFIPISFPCKGFSMANRALKNPEAERTRMQRNKENNDLSLIGIQVATHCKPELILCENVMGMMNNENIEYPKKLFAMLLSSEYQITLYSVNSRDFSVPQDRQRVFIAATPFGSRLPGRPTKSADIPVTVQEVIGEVESILPVSGAGRIRLQDGTIVAGHKLEGAKERTEMEHLSQCENGLAPTVRCGRAIKHYFHARCLTQYELKLIQGFPREYQFVGTDRQIRTQIGNAIPPPLAKAVGKTLLQVYNET
jgi:DNA (cytosine-5)-methyltransferase 1